MSAISLSNNNTANPLLLNTNISPMKVLTQAAQAAAAATTQREVKLVQNQLTQYYQKQITEAEAAANPTQAQTDQQNQINSLSQQSSVFTSAQTRYGTNANIFADLTNRLVTLQNAASSGNSAAFDAALSQANTDVNNLEVVSFNLVFQPDGVTGLKLSGLGIQSSSTYNLGTSAGQAAALAAVSQAQQVVQQSSNATGENQNEAATQVLSLNGLISSLQANLQESQVAQISASTQEVSNLQQQLQDRLNLIQIQLGNSSELAQELGAAADAVQNLFAPPAPGTVLSLLA